VRIELGEIESALSAQPDIAAAAVVALQEATGDRRLVAYVVALASPDPEELRARLARRLPAAMVPAAWVFLDALPLTPNGRWTAARCPPPSRCTLSGSSSRRARRSRNSRRHLARGAEGRPRGGRRQFLGPGGHSLIATKVLARVRDNFGIELPLQSLFTTPRLGEFAAAVGQSVWPPRPRTRRTSSPSSTASPKKRSGRCSPPKRGPSRS